MKASIKLGIAFVSVIAVACSLLYLSPDVSASEIVSETYGEGTKTVAYQDGTKEFTDGVQTYLRYDDVWRPISELNFSDGNWTYTVTDYSTYYLINSSNITFKLPKRNWIAYDFHPDLIKETITVKNLSTLINISIGNSTVRYLPLNFSPSIAQTQAGNLLQLGRFKTKDFWIRDSNNSYYDVENRYQLKVIGGEIRLYFDDLAWFQNATYPLTIDPTWIVGNASGQTWTNVTYSNTRKSNGQYVRIDNNITDYVSYWDFDDGRESTAYDLNLTNANNGTLTNMNTGLDNGTSGWNSSGKYGNAISFDGVDDFVNMNDGNKFSPTKNLSISAWFKATTLPTALYARMWIVSKGQDSPVFDFEWAVLTNGDGSNAKIKFVLWDTSGSEYLAVQGTTSLQTNTWYHVVGIFDNSTKDAFVYLNGIQEASDLTETTDLEIDGVAPTRIGARGDAAANYFSGVIDEVRIYNRSLTSAEIATEYNRTFKQTGNLTGSQKDAESIGSVGDVWNQIKFEGNTPSNTNVSIYYSGSKDNSSWTGWKLIQSNATSGTNYDIPNADTNEYIIPSKYQTRYGQWRLVLEGNTSLTPEIYNVTMTSGTCNDCWSGNVTYENTRKSNGQYVRIDNNITNYVSYWDFDDGSGSTKAYDLNLTNANNGTLTNMNTTGNATSGWNSTDCKFGSCLKFDGVNDYVTLGKNIVTGAVTYSFWIKTSINAGQTIFTNVKSGVVNDGILFKVTASGVLEVYYFSADTIHLDIWTTQTVTDGQWHYVVFSWTGDTTTNGAKIYIDGIQRVQGTSSLSDTGVRDVNDMIGALLPTPTNVFNGTIDEVRIYNRSLSAEEIATEYNKTFKQTGNLTGSQKDAESIGDAGDVWDKIKFEGSVPTNTNVSLYVNTSADGSSWSGYTLVQANATSNTNYTLPAGNQQRYGRWRLVLEGNTSLTPEVYNVTMTSVAGGDTTPPSITVTSPLNQTYTTIPINLNITLNEAGSLCQYNLNDTANITLSNSSQTNWFEASGLNPAQATHRVYVYCNDTSNNWGSNTSVWFTYSALDSTFSIAFPITYSGSFNESVTANITASNSISFNFSERSETAENWVQPNTGGDFSNNQSGSIKPIILFYNTGNVNEYVLLNMTVPTGIQVCANSTCVGGDCTGTVSVCTDIGQSSFVSMGIVNQGKQMNVTLYANKTSSASVGISANQLYVESNSTA